MNFRFRLPSMFRRTAGTTADPTDRRAPRRRVLAGAGALVALVAATWLVSKATAVVARYNAAQCLARSAPYSAQWWLSWAARLDQRNYRNDLLEAACFRCLMWKEAWAGALERAEHEQAPAERVAVERAMAQIHSGDLRPANTSLVEREVAPGELAAAVLHGYVAQNNPRAAQAFISAWAARFPDRAHIAYLEGVFLARLGQFDEAQRRFSDALARQADHELARGELAAICAQQGRLNEALVHHVELAASAGARQTAIVPLSRVLRKLGRVTQARAVLAPLAARSDADGPVHAELAEIELELGDYDRAQQWFAQLSPEKSSDSNLIHSAASNLALLDRPQDAERLFAKDWVGMYQLRLAADRPDQETTEELKRIAQSAPASPQSAALPSQPSPSRTGELYTLHCGVCHGARGDGRGFAARHLFPRPRDLRSGKSRLVSTRNGVPTLGDLEAVLDLGMPGTSMPSFQQLDTVERKLLAEEVLRLRREGAREELLAALQEQGETPDDEELQDAVQTVTTPGDAVRVPPLSEANQLALVRGKQVYLQLGCHNCHGNDGRGATDQAFFDDWGNPTRARDLVYEPFAGTRDWRAVYFRLAVGMPGTAHPAAAGTPDEELVDLVHFVLSLAGQPVALTNHKRWSLSEAAAYLRASSSARSP